MYYCIDERTAVYSSIFFADDIDRRRKKSIINPIVVMKYLLFIALHVCGLFQNKSTNNQAFKILRADSCTSDVETRMKFKKMDKYS